MDTRQKIVALVAAAKNGTEPPAEALLGAAIAHGRERTQEKQELLGFLGRSKPRNQETKRILADCSTQVAPIESYKAQKSALTPEAEMLFERYGDVMGIVDNHPTFRKATAPIAEGGWGVYPQALTRACKEHSIDGDLGTGVLKVLEAIRYTANYRAARNKASFLWAVLRNGMRKEA
jgi:hypothetical protein